MLWFQCHYFLHMHICTCFLQQPLFIFCHLITFFCDFNAVVFHLCNISRHFWSVTISCFYMLLTAVIVHQFSFTQKYFMWFQCCLIYAIFLDIFLICHHINFIHASYSYNSSSVFIQSRIFFCGLSTLNFHFWQKLLQLKCILLWNQSSYKFSQY